MATRIFAPSRRGELALPVSLAFWTVALVAALDFARLHVTLNDQNPNATLDAVIAGEAETPYRYRILIPLLIRGVERATAWLGLPLDRLDVAALIDAGFVLGVVAVVHALVRPHLKDGRLAAVAALAVLAPLFHTYALRPQLSVYYPWDVPQVFAFALGIYLILNGRWVAFYALFAVATVNRETTFFLTFMVVAVHLGRVPPRVLLGHVMAQAVLWAAIRWGVVVSLGTTQAVVVPALDAERATPGKGDLFWVMLPRNVAWLSSHPQHLMQIAGLYAYTLLPILAFAHRLPAGPARRLLWVLVPYFGMLWCVGVVEEVRVYGEMIPLVWLAGTMALAAGFGLAPREDAPTADLQSASAARPASSSRRAT